MDEKFQKFLSERKKNIGNTYIFINNKKINRIVIGILKNWRSKQKNGWKILIFFRKKKKRIDRQHTLKDLLIKRQIEKYRGFKKIRKMNEKF